MNVNDIKEMIGTRQADLQCQIDELTMQIRNLKNEMRKLNIAYDTIEELEMLGTPTTLKRSINDHHPLHPSNPMNDPDYKWVGPGHDPSGNQY